MPADPRPHVHLSPLDEGLALELYVHPFGGFGPQLRPGQGRSTLLAERDRQAVRCTRDLEAELVPARGLLERCPALLGGAGWEWTLDDLDLALGALEQLHALGEAAAPHWPAGRPIGLTGEAQVGQMRVAIRQRRDWLEIEGGLTLEDGRILAMQELLKLCAEAKGRYVALGEGQFLVLSQALRLRSRGCGDSPMAARFDPLAAPAIEETVAGMALSAAPAWRGLLRRLAEMQDLEPQVPSTLQVELRDYQVEGYRWLARLAHWGGRRLPRRRHGPRQNRPGPGPAPRPGIQGADPRGGPPALCGNWMDEAPRFAPTRRPHRFGNRDRAAVLKNAGPFDLIVAMYGLLMTQGEKLLAENHWETVVADEAQAFKNAATKRTETMMRLKAGFRMIATGTPIENHLGSCGICFASSTPACSGPWSPSTGASPSPWSRTGWRGAGTGAPASTCASSCGPSSCGGSRVRS